MCVIFLRCWEGGNVEQKWEKHGLTGCRFCFLRRKLEKKKSPDPRRTIAAVQRSWFRAKQRVLPASTRVFSRSNECIKHEKRERERKGERERGEDEVSSLSRGRILIPVRADRASSRRLEGLLSRNELLITDSIAFASPSRPVPFPLPIRNCGAERGRTWINRAAATRGSNLAPGPSDV